MDIRFPAFFIRLSDTGYQFIYLLYLIWSSNASAIKQAENIFAALRTNGRQKLFWTGLDRGRNQCFTQQQHPWEHQRRVVIDPGVLDKTITLLRLAGYEMIITNSTWRVIYQFTSSTPS